METYEVQKSYAQWLGKTDADLAITLNTERELVDTNLLSSFDQLSAVLRKYCQTNQKCGFQNNKSKNMTNPYNY